MIGKSDVEFSNHWKNGSEIFQALENPAEKVPLAAGRSFGQATPGKSRPVFPTFGKLAQVLPLCTLCGLSVNILSALQSSPHIRPSALSATSAVRFLPHWPLVLGHFPLSLCHFPTQVSAFRFLFLLLTSPNHCHDFRRLFEAPGLEPQDHTHTDLPRITPSGEFAPTLSNSQSLSKSVSRTITYGFSHGSR